MAPSSESTKAASRRPKVVRIIARLNVGGPARQACLLHEKLADHADTWLIFGSLAAGEQDMSRLLASTQHTLRLPDLSREISLWADVRALWKVLRFLRKERPDIVHTHTAKAGAIGRLAAWLAGVPVIVHTYHGHVFRDYFGPWRSKMYVAIERALGRLTTRVVAISGLQRHDLALEYRIVPPNKITVIQNGFEFENGQPADRETARRELGVPTGSFVAAWVGRMVPIKDVHLLAEVVRRSCERKNPIFFLVAGDGTERPRLESLIEGCTNVKLLGWQQNVNRLWAAADAALLTSRNEGTPTALVEAMSAGLPFVATSVGAVPDLAVEPLRELPADMGVEAANGFLTSRKPEAVLHCIERLAGDSQLAERMAASGRTFALKRFSAQRLVAEMSLLYQTLLGSEVETSLAPAGRGASASGDKA
jgi:glycosyltransferase involved in cell wall biosynthesis